MARNYQKRYTEYRGRRPRSHTVFKIMIILLALVLIGLFVFAVILGGGVEYTDEGVRLVLPWVESSPSPEPSPSAEGKPPFFVVEETESPSPTPTPAPEPERHPDTIGAVEVTIDELLAGTAAGTVKNAGGNALVVEMKTSSGKVLWYSDTAFAGPDAGEGQPVADALAALAAEDELHLVARVLCFRDDVLAGEKVGGPLMTRGGNMWYDSRGLRWVSPAAPEARGYLIDLCLELAELGFDEILLECAGYPFFGETHVLATDELRPADLSGPVEQFWKEMKAALAERNVQMSLLVTEEMALWVTPTGTGATISGITPELMARYADRVWVKAMEGVDYTEQPVCAPIADRLVIIGGTEQGSWASIDDPVP